MRIWSLHPKYLDTKGLLALWRETLLAKNVLEGKTKGYINHPQLLRFKESSATTDSINYYLSEVYNEANRRGYNFDKSKFAQTFKITLIPVTSGQIQYEKNHLLNKLQKRDPERYEALKQMTLIDVHPIFNIIDGDIENWEILDYSKTASSF